ncbi:MAG: hypothetical protein ABSF64_30450 [Bryobacteraceae bacterium]|jgi:hypothetical protein
MKNSRLTSVACIAVSALAGLAQTAASADNTPPGYDLKPQALQDLEIMQKHFAELADAIPPEKFTGRAGEGVRSFSGVFLHVASLNFSLAPTFGAAPVAGFTQKDYEKSATDKTVVVSRLNRSSRDPAL